MLGLSVRTQTRPLPVCLTKLLAVEAHDVVSERLGVVCAAKEEIKFKNFLVDNNIPLFDYAQVSKYLFDQAYKQHGSDKSWAWIPLRERDKPRPEGRDDGWFPVAQFTGPASDDSLWYIVNYVYKQIVPTKVLLDLEKVQEAFPAAKLYVSEITRFPDPFAAVLLPGVGIYVIGVWDEPGFGP